MNHQRVAPQRAPASTMNTSSAGVVQAHVSDGALQARVKLWNVKLTAGIHPSGQAIQRKSAQGVEAFRVPLRQKAGGLPLPSDVRTKMETAS